MAIRLAFGAILVAATVLLHLSVVRRMLIQPGALRGLQVLFVASRAAGWLVAYVLLADLTRYTDLVLYYYPEALMVTEGRLPYLDFQTSYGPVFPYIAAVFLPLWNNQAAVALAMVLLEVVAVLAFVNLVRRNHDVPRGSAEWTLAVYLVNPAALYWSGMMGYNSSIVLLCWVAAMWALEKNRYAVSTIWLATSVIAGKFLGVLVAPVWLAHPRRRYLVVAVAGVVTIGLWLLGRRYGMDLTLPLLREGNRATGGNLWFLAGGLIPFASDGVVWRYGPPATLALVATALMAWLAFRWREAPHVEQLCGAVSAMGWLFLVTSKKSYPHYAPMFLLFTVLALSAGRSGSARWTIVLAVISAVGIVEPGLWNALGQPQLLGQAIGGATGIASVPLIAADVVLVSGGVGLVLVSARIAGRRPAAMSEVTREGD